jgi:uncharacterized protein with FMN-binding domain
MNTNFMEENQPASSSSSGSKKWVIIAVVAGIIILIAAGGGFFFFKNQEENSPAEMNEPASSEGNTQMQVTPTTEAMPSSSSSGTPSKSSYKDGTYNAEGSYMTHAGSEKIGVTITIKDGKVTDVSVKQLAVRPMSKTMQADFAANYKVMVVGKDINTLKLGKVSGSSLTPMGFNAALETIKTQAKS